MAEPAKVYTIYNGNKDDDDRFVWIERIGGGYRRVIAKPQGKSRMYVFDPYSLATAIVNSVDWKYLVVGEYTPNHPKCIVDAVYARANSRQHAAAQYAFNSAYAECNEGFGKRLSKAKAAAEGVRARPMISKRINRMLVEALGQGIL